MPLDVVEIVKILGFQGLFAVEAYMLLNKKDQYYSGVVKAVIEEHRKEREPWQEIAKTQARQSTTNSTSKSDYSEQ